MKKTEKKTVDEAVVKSAISMNEQGIRLQKAINLTMANLKVPTIGINKK
jgi:hypothetical protein